MKNNKCLNAKLFCKRIEKLNVLIENKQEEIKQLHRIIDQNNFYNSHYKRVQAPIIGFNMKCHKIAQIEVERLLQDEIKALIIERQSKISLLEKMNMSSYQVLYKTFVQGYALEDITEQYNRSYSYIAMLKGKALEELENMLS